MKPRFLAWPLLASLSLAACTTGPNPNLAARSAPAPLGATCLPFAGVAAEIATARTRFNEAIAEADLAAIASVLTEETLLIAGTGSEVFSGREAQLAIWAEDFASPDTRLVYARAPACITASPIAPIAMEYGFWRGAASGNEINSVSGEYSAKWRKTDGQWRIEAETYLTTSCTGTLCPAGTPGPAQ